MSSNCILACLLRVPFARRSEQEQMDIINGGRPTPLMSALVQKTRNKSTGPTFNRAFKNSWYTVHKWICGSEELNKLFCWPCALFGKRSDVWVRQGYGDLKHLHSSADAHSKSKDHLFNFMTLKQYVRKTRINVVSEGFGEKEKQARFLYNADVTRNREIFKRVIDVVCLLCKQEIPFGGNEESGISLDMGNFEEILELTINYSDSLKEQWIKLGRSSCLSTDERNELVCCIAEQITAAIHEDIDKAAFFSCLLSDVSEYTDNHECCITLRFVNEEGQIQEHFLGFYSIGESRSASAMWEVFREALERFSIKDKVVAYTYDGTVLTGNKLSDFNDAVNYHVPQAQFIPCFPCKHLNWILQQGCQCIDAVKVFFSCMLGMCRYFKQSEERASIFQSLLRRKISACNEWVCLSIILLAVCQERTKLVGAFNEIERLNKMSADSVYEAEAYKIKLREHQFLFLALVFRHIFVETSKLHAVLQESSIDERLTCDQLSRVLSALKNMKSEPLNKQYFEQASNVIGHGPVETHDESGDEIKCQQLLFQIVDNIVAQLHSRFSNLTSFRFLQLGNPKRFKEFKMSFPEEELMSLQMTYGDCFGISVLKNQLEIIYARDIFYDADLESVESLLKLIIANDMVDVLPLAYKLFCLVATIPAFITESCCLNRIKSFLRSTLSKEGFSSLTFRELHVHTNQSPLATLVLEKELLTKLKRRYNWYDSVIGRFTATKGRTVQLLYK